MDTAILLDLNCKGLFKTELNKLVGVHRRYWILEKIQAMLRNGLSISLKLFKSWFKVLLEELRDENLVVLYICVDYPNFLF